MKRSSYIFAIVMTAIMFIANVYASEPAVSNNKKTNLAETNLLEGLNSGNEGLQISAAYYLGEMKSEKAVIPLMKFLHTSQSENARIIAALSLYKIGNAKGLYAVKENSKFDESDKVRRLCENFYITHKLEKKKN